MDQHLHDEHSSDSPVNDDGSQKMVELDRPPSGRLFIMLFILSVAVAVSMVGLWQLTNFTILSDRASAEPDPRLVNLRRDNIAARDLTSEVCVAACDSASAVKHVSVGRAVSLMTQEWARLPGPGGHTTQTMQRTLIAPFGPKALPPQSASAPPVNPGRATMPDVLAKPPKRPSVNP